MTISNGFDSYWKLDTYDELTKDTIYRRLQALGLDKVSLSRTKADLVTILHRHDSGRICFDRYTDAELWARGLQYRREHNVVRNRDNTISHAARVRLIKFLEEQDDAKYTFKRFLDIPPELRNRVYEFYIADFPSSLKLPTKPPLSRTCRLLRQEVLPVFYANFEFEICLTQHSRNYLRFLEEHTTQLFLLNLAPTDVACIKKLKLLLNRAKPAGAHEAFEEMQISYSIDLGLNRCEFEVTPSRQDNHGHRRHPWRSVETMSRLAESIQELLKGLEGSNGKGSFRVEDIHRLRRLVEREFR